MKLSRTFCSSSAFAAATFSGSPFTVRSNVFSTTVSGPPEEAMAPADTQAVSVTAWSAAVRVTAPV